MTFTRKTYNKVKKNYNNKTKKVYGGDIDKHNIRLKYKICPRNYIYHKN